MFRLLYIEARCKGKAEKYKSSGRIRADCIPTPLAERARLATTVKLTYIYYLGSATQASDYETTTSFIINHIMKTYTRGLDIAEALETLEELDFTTSKPTLKKSTETDVDLKKTEEKQF